MFTTIMALHPKASAKAKNHRVPQPRTGRPSPSERRMERLQMLQYAYRSHPTVAANIAAGKYEEVYNMIAQKLDPNGFKRFFVAESYTGINVHEFFYIEDSMGAFEAADGNTMLDWLESAAFGILGWKVIQDGVETVANRVICKDSEEYKTYRTALHKSTVEKLLGIDAE